MDWRDHATFFVGLVAQIIGEARLTIALTIALLIFLLLLWIAVARRAPGRRDHRAAATLLPTAATTLGPASPPLIPLAPLAPAAPSKNFSLEGVDLGKARTILPKDPRAFLALVIALMAGCWGLGFALTPDRQSFLASPEWRFQPFYIAAHLLTLRLIIGVYTRNFTAGVTRLAIDAEQGSVGLKYILGPVGRFIAVAIAAPLCFLDYQYLTSARYAKLSGSASVSPADLLMWGIWSLEWLINAFLWVVLVGYSLKNCWILRRYPFKAPVDAVLHERHYKPFLQMSAQGSTILLAFSLVTVFYITYTGGELSDYVGLCITCVLLALGFLVPWAVLKAKIRRTVKIETHRLQQAVSVSSRSPHHAASVDAAAPDLRALESRLNEAVAMLRITHLDRIHLNLGRTEARAIMLRLLAPMATIGWQVFQNASETLLKLERFLQWLSLGLKRLAG